MKKQKLMALMGVSCSGPGARQMEKAEKHTAKMTESGDGEKVLPCFTLLSAESPCTRFPSGYSDIF